MSRARPTRRSRMAGFSLMETMLVVTLMGGMSLLLGEAIQTVQEADDYMLASGRAVSRGGRITSEIAGLAAESRHFYQNNDRGRAYVAACRLAHPVAANTRLPIFDPHTDLQRDDANDPHTGNMLLLVRETNASACVADAEAGLQRYVDTYRMVGIYPSTTGKPIISGTTTARDLVVWRSVAFPSYQQLLEIGDLATRISIVKDLVGRYGFTHAWDPRRAVDEAFFALDAFGGISDRPDATVKLEEDDLLSKGGRLLYARVQLAGTAAAGSRKQRAVLSADAAGTWTPGGFEVKIGGPSGSRKVWIHTVVESPAAQGHAAVAHATTTVVHARDF